MKISAHVEKWKRFDALRNRFDPAAEFELWYWATLSGGTTIINAALHACGITDENNRFATQIPDVYAVPDGQDRWHHEIGVNCDLIHVGMPEVTKALPAAVQRAFDAMDVIERYRDPCVRGDTEVTAEIIAACEKAYDEIVAATKSALNGGRS